MSFHDHFNRLQRIPATPQHLYSQHLVGIMDVDWVFIVKDGKGGKGKQKQQLLGKAYARRHAIAPQLIFRLRIPIHPSFPLVSFHLPQPCHSACLRLENVRILSVSLDLTWLNRCCLLKQRLWSLLAAAASLQKCQSLQPAASSCSWEEVTAPSSIYFVGTQKTHFGSGLLHKQPLPVMVYCKISIVRDDQGYANFHSMNTHERRIQYITIIYYVCIHCVCTCVALAIHERDKIAWGLFMTWYRFAPGIFSLFPGIFFHPQCRINSLAICSILNLEPAILTVFATFRERLLWHLLHFEARNWP